MGLSGCGWVPPYKISVIAIGARFEVIYYLKYGSVALRALCARKLEAIA
ncbi:MAG: hypothetical protein ACHBN1_28685 [Heteroscytonema crispum UTEX LB 1556]